MSGLLMGPMLSHHFDRDMGYNEVHPAIGYQTDGGWGGGVYKNSHNKTSAYLGKEWRKHINGLLDLNLQAGLVTGYPESSVLPALMPGLIGKLGGGHELNLLLMPPSKKTGKGGVALQYRKQLKD